MKKQAPASPDSPYANVRRTWLFPKTLTKAMDFSTAASLKKRGFGERNIVRDWESIVGPELATQTFPLKLAMLGPQGPCALYIKASGPFALIVQHSEPKILERLALYYGRTMAHRVIIVQ